jgi:TRAP-type mannitol/chloroaromatic compound transport system substrate-binding protein
MINLDKWNELPDSYKGVIKNASALANSVMMARYDTLNPKVAQGAGRFRHAAASLQPADPGSLLRRG